MNIHTDEDVSRFKQIYSDMLDANENYFVSTYLIDFNYRHLISKIKMNKSSIADVGDFPLSYPCEIGTLHQGKYETYLIEDRKNWP